MLNASDTEIDYPPLNLRFVLTDALNVDSGSARTLTLENSRTSMELADMLSKLDLDLADLMAEYNSSSLSFSGSQTTRAKNNTFWDRVHNSERNAMKLRQECLLKEIRKLKRDK
jgi:hypothetical protein